MKKLLFLGVAVIFMQALRAQKVDSIFFHLYTDSLKKGFYNYINVDGKMSDGTWLPLDSSHIRFTATGGQFNGNDLFVDSSFTGDFITVTAVLRQNPSLRRQVTIYIKKKGFDEPLPTNEMILDDLRRRRKQR
ncbi:MAG TPA: hypothetical protein VFZ78_08700 [Flavisolibacter sp.]